MSIVRVADTVRGGGREEEEDKMPVRRTRNAGNAQQLSREMRLNKLTLFIQQFEKEAQERMSDLAINSTPDQSIPVQRSSSKTSKGGNGTKKTRILAGSNSTGNLRGSTATAKRTQSRVTKTSDHTVPTKPKLRSVVSAGDLHCSMAGSAAHITVTTAHGQTVSFSEETKDEINLDLLDDLAWCQIQRLTSSEDGAVLGHCFCWRGSDSISTSMGSSLCSWVEAELEGVDGVLLLAVGAVGIDLCGRAAEGECFLLDVVWEALQAGDEDQACGLELLGEGTCQGQ
ncbi:hypothetical protein INR49_011762, partial [Caranx melampygus]